jgi:hypothetical protein
VSRVELPSKLLGETLSLNFDFAAQLEVGETISTKTVIATVYSGTDASPSSIISGAATSSGSVVSQKITSGVLGVIYELVCQVTTSAGKTCQQTGLLAIVPASP